MYFPCAGKKMKQILSISFIGLYIVVIIGITTLVHFCGHTIDSIDIFPVSSSENPCCCGSTQQKSCCRTELRIIQIQDNQIAAASWTLPALDIQQFIEFQPLALPNIDARIVHLISSGDSPPGNSPIYILNCTMLV